MMFTPNPFTNRGPVTHPQDFIGRTAQLDKLVSRLRTMQSLSVVGERRIGKSSLLYHLTQTGRERLADERYRFFYLDLLDVRFHTPQHFLQTLLRRLGLDGAAIREGDALNGKLIAFTEQIETLAATEQRLVLCLDEFEVLFGRRAQFNDDFFEHFRGQLQFGKLAFVTATRETLQTLRLAGKLTSPFDNIFTTVELHDFTEAEAAEFIGRYGAQVNFTEAEMNFIASHFDLHPLRLRILCDQVLTNRQGRLADWALAEELGKAYGDFFPDKSDEYLSKAKRAASLDSIGKVLGLIKQARDLFTGKGDK